MQTLLTAEQLSEGIDRLARDVRQACGDGPLTVVGVLTGSVVVEKIFNVPGIGPYFVDAAFNRDYFLVLGIVILYAGFLLVMNLLVDVVYGLLDPRIEYS